MRHTPPNLKANQNHKSPQISPYMDEVYGQKNRSGDRQRCVLSPKANSHVIKRRQRHNKQHHDEQALMTGEIQRPPCIVGKQENNRQGEEQPLSSGGYREQHSVPVNHKDHHVHNVVMHIADAFAFFLNPQFS